jgi:streptomycin 6-kinase
VPCVLKIAGPEHNAIDEAIALEAWNGNGAARLLEADREHGTLLLERLDSDRTLRIAELITAAEIAGVLHPDRARAWTIVQAVDWLWCLGVGLTEDPRRCERLLATLDP